MKLHLVKKIAAGVALATAATAATSVQAEISANAGVSNNYLWRGLTQSNDEPVISGGIDYASESGFYAGTWVANVQYGSDGPFSYEHDLYLGFSGEAGSMSYDIGYLYVNYNDVAEFDFSEIYGSIGFGDFSVTAYLLATTEPDEEDYTGEDGGEADFGFASAYYISLDYGFDLGDDWAMGLHLGYHEGDFVDVFNFGDGTYDYIDYSVTFEKEAFAFTISSTDLDDSPSNLNNDDIKYVVSYTFEI